MIEATSPDQPSHRDIIARGGGPSATARRIEVDPNTVKGWNRLNSIPAAHWERLADEKLATLEELAAAAARKLSLISTETPSSQSEAA